MSAVTSWFRGHRTLASVVTISLILGVPLTFAAINRGYPITDVQLSARDVWVTNSQDEHAGRINTQVGELDATVPTVSTKYDVLQDGETILLRDPDTELLRQVDSNVIKTSPALTSRLPAGASAKLDGGILAIESGRGQLWRVPVSDTTSVNFVAGSTPPAHIPRLPTTSQINVERDGTVDAVTTSGTLYQLDAVTGAVRTLSIPKITGAFQVSSVGTVPVILDLAKHELIEGDGSTHAAPGAVSLQLPGDNSPYALLQTDRGLLRINLSTGLPETVLVNGATAGGTFAQPVHMANCDNAVWSATATAVYACGSSKQLIPLGAELDGHTFQYRVNQLSVALNDTNNGFAWLTGSQHAINDWKTILAANQSPKTGKAKGKNVTLVETPPQFSSHDQPPKAVDISIGVRPGATTPLPVLAYDSDPDGDVLTVSDIGQTPDSLGQVEPSAGGQSPQFTPAAGVQSGSADVRYSISDGRLSASATLRITIVPFTAPDTAPKPHILASEVVEQGQTVTYNVLDDWFDPDGDAMQLVSARSASGDDVRFTPDGYVTFQSASGTGIKTVSYTVEDSAGIPKQSQGTLTVDVLAAGTTPPIAESDYASGFTGEAIEVSPLLNDKSPSGQPLHIQSIKQVYNSGGAPILNSDKGTVQISENRSGMYEFEYQETAGDDPKIVNGFIRVDVVNRPSGHVAPIAVSDVAYLTYPGTVTVPVLDNDVSPQDLVLGVVSISVPTISGFTAQLQSNTSIKISATGTSGGDKPVLIEYTISDGTKTSLATVTVVAVSQLQTHQSPITTDDLVTVRAGNVATASVLDNDVDPDGAAMSVAQKLVQYPSAGLAFVTGNEVRFQAPSTAGQYIAVYSVMDTANQSRTGRVVFNVVAASKKANRPPQPVPVISRVIAGGTVRVQIPLAGIDPDGDTSLLQSVPQNPQLGKITNITSTYFDYQAAKGVSGTDEFLYRVVDSNGAPATAIARIGVMPRAGLQLPNAIDDVAALRPNGHATVTVLANDSDPNGYSISLVHGSLRNLGTKSISASIDGNTVVLHAGPTEGDYSVRYTITDGHAKPVNAIIHVTVKKSALNLPPIAIDHILQSKDVATGKPVSVLAIEGASDPSGLIPSLTVSLVGAKSADATRSGSHIVVTPSKRKNLTIGYTLTDPDTHLSSTAFILVPPIPPKGWNLAPYLKKDLKEQTVQVSTPRQFALKDLVTVPGTAPAKLINASRLSATHGTVKYDGSGNFTYSPTKLYAGPAAITFDVSDSAQAAHVALLTLPVTVLDKDGSDLEPSFTTVHVDAAQRDTTTVDLANSTINGGQVSWAVTGAADGITLASGGTRGSVLKITVPESTKEGSLVTLHVTLTTPAPSSYTVVGSVMVHVVTIHAPLAQAITDTAFIKRNGTATIYPLSNDVNPTPEKPLRIVAPVLSDNLNGAQPTTDGTSVQYTPPAGFVGSVSLHYKIEDATGDADREVTGEILVTVWDVPDAPGQPVETSSGDSTVTFTFDTPAKNNGSPVTSYAVRSVPATSTPTCTAGAACTFTGLTDGTSYTFFATATNAVGISADSPQSLPMIPYGTPDNITAGASNGPAVGDVTVSWSHEGNARGGSANYEYRIHGNAAWVSGGTVGPGSAEVSIGANNSASFDVRVCNDGGICSGIVTTNTATAPAPPAPLVWLTSPNVGADSVVVNYQGLSGFTPTQFRCWGATNAGGSDPHQGGWSPSNAYGEYLGLASGTWPGGDSGSFTIVCPGGIQNPDAGRDYFSVDLFNGHWSQELKTK